MSPVTKRVSLFLCRYFFWQKRRKVRGGGWHEWKKWWIGLGYHRTIPPLLVWWSNEKKRWWKKAAMLKVSFFLEQIKQSILCSYQYHHHQNKQQLYSDEQNESHISFWGKLVKWIYVHVQLNLVLTLCYFFGVFWWHLVGTLGIHLKKGKCQLNYVSLIVKKKVPQNYRPLK